MKAEPADGTVHVSAGPEDRGLLFPTRVGSLGAVCGGLGQEGDAGWAERRGERRRGSSVPPVPRAGCIDAHARRRLVARAEPRDKSLKVRGFLTAVLIIKAAFFRRLQAARMRDMGGAGA